MKDQIRYGFCFGGRISGMGNPINKNAACDESFRVRRRKLVISAVISTITDNFDKSRLVIINNYAELIVIIERGSIIIVLTESCS